MTKSFSKTFISFSLVFSFNAFSASSGTLIVHGGISENTCEISSGDEYKLLFLPVIGKTTLTAKDSVAGATNFSIKLSNCPKTLSKAGLFFESGPSIFSDSGLLKAYKLGATAPLGNSTKFPSPLDKPSNNADYLQKVLSAASSQVVSSNLSFELLDNNGVKIKAGDASQLTQEGLFVSLNPDSGNAARAEEESEGFSSGEFIGSIRYRNYGGSAPDSGFYFSHVGFTIQYP